MPTPNLQRAMAPHRDAVYARDVPTFMALSNDQVRVFGLQETWVHDRASWRDAAT